ncbi:putative acetyltransferase protein [Sulfitobacter noctilucae]|nr:putative acetyltransferase protein [Sulfitobacter noctilucae]
MTHALAAHHGDSATVTEQDLARDCLGPHPWFTVLIAATPEAAVGYAALCPLAQMQFGVRGMDLHHLFVMSDARGKGIGQDLIAASLATTQLMKGRYMTVGTHPDNHPAAALYAQLGFEVLPPPGPRFRMKLAG